MRDFIYIYLYDIYCTLHTFWLLHVCWRKQAIRKILKIVWRLLLMHGCINAKLLLSPPPKSICSVNWLAKSTVICFVFKFGFHTHVHANCWFTFQWFLGKVNKTIWSKNTTFALLGERNFFYFLFLNICMLSAHKCFCLFPPNCFQPSTQFEFVFVSHFVKMFLLLAALLPVNNYKYLRNIEYKYDIV